MEVQKVKLSIVELTPENMSLFQEFMKHYDSFKKLADRGVFRLDRGKVELNITGGVIRNTKITVSFDEKS